MPENKIYYIYIIMDIDAIAMVIRCIFKIFKKIIEFEIFRKRSFSKKNITML
jgi:hypothetical protein